MDAVNIQITVDCADPHRMARFWGSALGYVVEDHHDVVTKLRDGGVLPADEVVDIDGRLGFRDGAAIRHPDDPKWRSPEASEARRILFQRVDDARPAKNTWHLDLNVGPDNIEATVTRLASLGAVRRYDIDEPGTHHTTMADPEGNLFCLQ